MILGRGEIRMLAGGRFLLLGGDFCRGGEGQDEGQRGRGLNYPLEGRDERLNCPPRFLPGCVLDPSPGLSPKLLHDFKERRNRTGF
jgi:hypothetical protein